MKSRDRRCQHPQLWVGYGLILAVIVLGVTAITAQFQHAALRATAAHQSREIEGLKARDATARQRLQQLDQVNHAQDQSLSIQRQDLARQQRAIHHLSRLRRIDDRALIALRDELAARHAGDAHIRARLEQLEHNNAAAQAAINAAKPEAKP